jgi:hypothetical protein
VIAALLTSCATQVADNELPSGCEALTYNTQGKNWNELLAESYRLGCIGRESYEASIQPIAASTVRVTHLGRSTLRSLGPNP